MTFDVTSFRAQFPSLESGIAHFDGPGGTQTPRAVGEAIAATLTGPLSIGGTGVASETNAEAVVAGFRSAYADLLGASPRGIVYGRSATQLTYDFSRHLAKTWRPGDEVVVSRLDHDANIRPWVRAAERAGAVVKWIEFDPATSEIRWDSVESAITDRTRLVAVTAASNLLGAKPPVQRIANVAHAVGALVWVDGVHYAAHSRVDVAALGADFFVCSPYKFLGPHCGVLAASPDLLETLKPDKLAPSTNAVPERFEFGTLPYEIMAGATAAVDFLARWSYGNRASDCATPAPREPATEDHPATDRPAALTASLHAIDEHEFALRQRVESGLTALGHGVTVHSRASSRTPTLLVTIAGRQMWDAYEFLAGRQVLAPAGSFYAAEAFEQLRLDDDHGLRIGLAPYTDEADVDRLLDGLAAFVASS